MTIRIAESVAEEIRRHGEEAYPAECCGVLAGRIGGDGLKEVVRLAPAVNRRTDDPHRYLIAPDDLRGLEARLRSKGWRSSDTIIRIPTIPPRRRSSTPIMPGRGTVTSSSG